MKTPEGNMDAEWIKWLLGILAGAFISYVGYVQRRFSDLEAADEERHRAERADGAQSIANLERRLEGLDKDLDAFKDRMLSTMATKDDLSALHVQWRDDMKAMEGRIMAAIGFQRGRTDA